MAVEPGLPCGPVELDLPAGPAGRERDQALVAQHRGERELGRGDLVARGELGQARMPARLERTVRERRQAALAAAVEQVPLRRAVREVVEHLVGSTAIAIQE